MIPDWIPSEQEIADAMHRASQAPNLSGAWNRPGQYELEAVRALIASRVPNWSDELERLAQPQAETTPAPASDAGGGGGA